MSALLLGLAQAGDAPRATLEPATLIVLVLFALFILLVWWGNRPSIIERHRAGTDGRPASSSAAADEETAA